MSEADSNIMDTPNGRTFHFNFSLSESFFEDIRSSGGGKDTEILLMSKCLSLTFGSLVCGFSEAISSPEKPAQQPLDLTIREDPQINGKSENTCNNPRKLLPSGKQNSTKTVSVCPRKRPLSPSVYANSLGDSLHVLDQRGTPELSLEDKLNLSAAVQEYNQEFASEKKMDSDLLSQVQVEFDRSPEEGISDKLGDVASTVTAEYLALVAKSRRKEGADKRQFRLSEWERTHFCCGICGKMFKHLTNVSRHKRMIHNATSETPAIMDDSEIPVRVLETNNLTIETSEPEKLNESPQESQEISPEENLEASYDSDSCAGDLSPNGQNLDSLASSPEIQGQSSQSSLDSIGLDLPGSFSGKPRSRQKPIKRPKPLPVDMEARIRPPFPIEISTDERNSLCCAFCKYQFTILSNLRRHKRVYGHYNKFHCTTCDEIFTSEERFSCHRHICGKIPFQLAAKARTNANAQIGGANSENKVSTIVSRETLNDERRCENPSQIPVLDSVNSANSIESLRSLAEDFPTSKSPQNTEPPNIAVKVENNFTVNDTRYLDSIIPKEPPIFAPTMQTEAADCPVSM